MRPIFAFLLGLAAATCGSPAPSDEPAPPAVVGPAVACHAVPPDRCQAVVAELAGRFAEAAVIEVYPEFVQVEAPDGGGRSGFTYEFIEVDQIAADEPREMGAGRLTPSSGPQVAPIVPFTLGHCGLASPIDVDGAYWDPVGQIPQDERLINATAGQFRRLGPTDAEFVVDGIRVRLRRHVGAKSPPGCD